jgi:hypothetical protein
MMSDKAAAAYHPHASLEEVQDAALVEELSDALDWHWPAAPGVPSSGECLADVATALREAGYVRRG